MHPWKDVTPLSRAIRDAGRHDVNPIYVDTVIVSDYLKAGYDINELNNEGTSMFGYMVNIPDYPSLSHESCKDLYLFFVRHRAKVIIGHKEVDPWDIEKIKKSDTITFPSKKNTIQKYTFRKKAIESVKTGRDVDIIKNCNNSSYDLILDVINKDGYSPLGYLNTLPKLNRGQKKIREIFIKHHALDIRNFELVSE
ncbi:MAG: hypothetical protein JW795_03630 [Chitinivibrionales bacterium]|nr:hypothetical protein [Chitinivibrionales bacterium]